MLLRSQLIQEKVKNAQITWLKHEYWRFNRMTLISSYKTTPPKTHVHIVCFKVNHQLMETSNAFYRFFSSSAQLVLQVKYLVRQIWISGISTWVMSSDFFKSNFYCVYLIWGFFFQQVSQLELSPIAWTECITRAYTPSSGNYKAESTSKVSYPKSVIKIFIFLVTNTWKLEITT